MDISQAIEIGRDLFYTALLLALPALLDQPGRRAGRQHPADDHQHPGANADLHAAPDRRRPGHRLRDGLDAANGRLLHRAHDRRRGGGHALMQTPGPAVQPGPDARRGLCGGAAAVRQHERAAHRSRPAWPSPWRRSGSATSRASLPTQPAQPRRRKRPGLPTAWPWGARRCWGRCSATPSGLFQVPARVCGEFLTEELGLSFGAFIDPTGTTGNVSALTQIIDALGVLLVPGAGWASPVPGGARRDFRALPGRGGDAGVPVQHLVGGAAADDAVGPGDGHAGGGGAVRGDLRADADVAGGAADQPVHRRLPAAPGWPACCCCSC